ncbi:MAG: CARDB domain-containing protein, partial [Poseidonia sp.]
DGEGTPEILVGFGRRFWAFDGDTGASADINDEWSTPLSMPHRVWTAPAVADIDGDGHIDVLFGDTLVSNRGVDLTPALDNRGLSFNPAQADPGQTVTVTGQFANVGTSEADEDVDAAIIMNGVELHRERFTSSDPVAPSGEGGPLTFSADFVAELGVHEFELVLDVNNNITEQREDNNLEFMQFSVVEPYLAELIGPLDPPRIPPGTSQQVDVQLMATGSKTADWMVSYDDSQLPEGWTFEVANNAALARELIPNVADTLTFDASVPSTALGDESGHVTLTLTLVSDPTVNTTIELQLDVFRTRGLDLTGASGMNTSTGHGRPGQTAKAWFMVENLGNAPESTTSITWTAPSWGGSPSIHDASGQQLFSIALNPGETKVLLAHLDTPSSTSYGSSTQSTLTMCMGSGEDALCESMPFTFIAHKVVAEPTHHRTLPGATLTWSLQGIVPTSGAAT